jgi:ribosomal protein S18 acetylase RimI-like enzyme
LPQTPSRGKLPGVSAADPARDISILPARSATDYADAARVIRAYAKSLPFPLDFQGFDREIADLAAEYGPPTGELLIARRAAAETLGCVGVRPLAGDACEMKRLYVLPTARGLGLGRTLAVRIIDAARHLGYRRMRLDTIQTMAPAMALYRSLGFLEIPAYYDNPVPGARYFELML